MTGLLDVGPFNARCMVHGECGHREFASLDRARQYCAMLKALGYVAWVHYYAGAFDV